MTRGSITPYQVSVAIAKEPACFEKMLRLGMEGLTLHNEIKKSEITLGEIIGKGNKRTNIRNEKGSNEKKKKRKNQEKRERENHKKGTNGSFFF